jgi:mutator protein MutT
VSPLPLWRVSAGILRDAAGRVLIAQRPPGKHMAGWWEFPGGKAAEGESGVQALSRELAEELGVRIGPCHRLLELRHDYADRSVVLDVYIVADYAGEPRGLEGQAVKWVAPGALGEERLLPADRPIVEALLKALSRSAAREATAEHRIVTVAPATPVAPGTSPTPPTPATACPRA